MESSKGEFKLKPLCRLVYGKSNQNYIFLQKIGIFQEIFTSWVVKIKVDFIVS